MRLTLPTEGFEARWLVATRGQYSVEQVGASLQRALGEAVAISECQAWHPLDCQFDTMALITVPRHLLSLFQQTIATDGVVHCYGATLSAFPFTHHPQDPVRLSPVEETMAEKLRTALLAPDHHTGRSTLLPPPCTFTPGSSTAPQGPRVATLARAQARVWRKREDGLASLVTAGCLHTATHVFQWRLDDAGTDLAALPPQLQRWTCVPSQARTSTLGRPAADGK